MICPVCGEGKWKRWESFDGKSYGPQDIPVCHIACVEKLSTELEQAEAELEALRRIAESALAIQDKVAAQQNFSRHLAELAAEARRTGLSQKHRIVEQPHVHDYGNVIAALCVEIDRWQKTRKRGRA